MENLNLEVITMNIFKLVYYSGITDLNFSQLLEISEKQLRLIKSSKAEFNISNINRACEFFDVSLSKMNDRKMVLENNLRETLALTHKNNLQFHTLLIHRPSIRHAIRFLLVQNEDFKNNGFIVSEIRNLFLKRGWDYTSRYISTSMGRNDDLIKIKYKQIKNGKQVNIYTSK